jgi:hypothetical protein
MTKFALVLLAIAAVSMPSCTRQQAQQSPNQARPQNSNPTAQNQPNEGQPQSSNPTAQNQPNEAQPQSSNPTAQNQPNEAQPQSSNPTAQNQPNEGQPQSSNPTAQNQPNEAQPQSSNPTAQNQPNEAQPQSSNPTAQNQPNEAQPQNSNPTAQNQPNEAQPQNSNPAAQNQLTERQPISPDSLSRDEVRQVQKALEKSGFHAGAANGRWGPETSNALKQFQQSKNIQANGKLDQQTLSGLGLNGAQFAQRNKGNGMSHRSGSRPFPPLHPSTMLNPRKRFQSRITVSKWHAKLSPNLPRPTFFYGGRRHGTTSTHFGARMFLCPTTCTPIWVPHPGPGLSATYGGDAATNQYTSREGLVSGAP